MEPTVYQAPILHERQYRATSREIQGTIVWIDGGELRIAQ